jgi:hypothetical protein
MLEKYFKEEASIREQQMSVQHRLDTNPSTNADVSDGYFLRINLKQTFFYFIFLSDVCLPAVFMPYKGSNNVFNPKAYQYFHPTGKK